SGRIIFSVSAQSRLFVVSQEYPYSTKVIASLELQMCSF
ncbi:MAG: hypothetical protein ACI8W1_000043, partial [Candidatus Azotimanducaceae bacterium]